MSRPSRREFFEQSLFAAAATAAVTSVSARAQDQPGPGDAQPGPGDASSPGPNDTLRHAILGCRIRGRAHAKAFTSRPGVLVTYVCDPDSELAESLADDVKELQGTRPRVVQDMRVVFDDPSVDTVSIATPNHWHALAAIWAMQAGKDVYVEKPVSHNIVEGRRMVEVARETGRICQAGTQNRSSGALTGAAQFLREGKLGSVRFARTIIYGRRGSIGGPGPCEMPPKLDFNLWLGPGTDETPTRRRLHYDWHWVWDTGNGELGNNNIHMIDICRWLMGLEGLGDSVVSFGGRLGYEDAGQTPNTQVVVHRFGLTTIVQEVRGLRSDPFSEHFKSGYVIEGTEGIIAAGSLFTPDGELVEKFSGSGDNHFANFIDAVRSRRREDLRAEIEEGHVSAALCHVGNVSYRLGQTMPTEEIRGQLGEYGGPPQIGQTFDDLLPHLRANDVDLSETPLTMGPVLNIDSDNERFTDAPEADRLLGREYRAPFNLPATS